jgi:hypothetical protein
MPKPSLVAGRLAASTAKCLSILVLKILPAHDKPLLLGARNVDSAQCIEQLPSVLSSMLPPVSRSAGAASVPSTRDDIGLYVEVREEIGSALRMLPFLKFL